MKRLFESFAGIIPITLFILYALAYCYLKGFYNQFDIDIDFYITLTDLLFYAIKTLLVGGSIYSLLIVINNSLSVFLGMIYLRKVAKKINKSKALNDKVLERFYRIKLERVLYSFSPPMYLIFGIIIFWITKSIAYSFSFTTFSVFSFYYSRFPVVSKSEYRLEIGKLRDRDYVFLFLLSVVFLLSYYQGMQNAYRVKNNINYFTKPVVCEFSNGNDFYSTDVNGELYYVGETTDYIFIYNCCTSKTLTFNKGNIENLRFLNSERISEKGVKFYFPFSKIFEEFQKI